MPDVHALQVHRIEGRPLLLLDKAARLRDKAFIVLGGCAMSRTRALRARAEGTIEKI